MIEFREAIAPGFFIVEFADEEGSDGFAITEDEARDLFNQMFRYFEKKDREVLAKRLFPNGPPRQRS